MLQKQILKILVGPYQTIPQVWKTGTYIERTVFREDVNTNNKWTFGNIGNNKWTFGNIGESTPTYVKVGFQARNEID